MRTKTRVALAAIAVGALTIGTAVPAGAQEEPETLGFAVDKTQAQPGALVLGKADAANVAEHCITDPEAFQTRLEEVLTLLLLPDAELVEEFFPESGTAFRVENFEQLAYVETALVLVGLFDPENAQEALSQTFVMTFADIATQEPVGERGNFDPTTGEGSVVVPDIEPGLWAVAAACVSLSTDVDTLAAGIRESAVFLEEELGHPLAHPLVNDPDFVEFAQDFLDSDATGSGLGIEFLTAIAPDLLERIVEIDAFGAVLFCILDDQGNCPADEPPPPPPGEPIEPEEPAAAQPVVAAPTFTG